MAVSKNSRSHFLQLVFFSAFCGSNVTSYTAKVSEGTNRNLPARNTLVQLLALYTNPESHNAQRYIMMPIADYTVVVGPLYDRLKTDPD